MKQKSKSQQVIDYLEKGNSLTKRECFDMFKLWNLGHEVWKLREKHGDSYITTHRESNKTGTHARYQLTNTNHLK